MSVKGMSLATLVQKCVFRRPADTGRYTGRTGGKAGFHPAFLSSVLHGGSQICWHLRRWTRRQLKSLGFQRGVRSRWHCCFSSPASVSFSLCRKSQAQFSFQPSLFLWDFTPFFVIGSIHTQVRFFSARVPPCDHHLSSPAITPLLACQHTNS